jgi:hypothetical protein
LVLGPVVLTQILAFFRVFDGRCCGALTDGARDGQGDRADHAHLGGRVPVLDIGYFETQEAIETELKIDKELRQWKKQR